MLHLRNIRLAGASNASMVTYIIPIFATIIGVVVLQEPLAWYAPVGAAIVLLGVAVASGRSGSGRRAVKETELWQRLRTTSGQGYYRVWAAEFSLADLGDRTVDQAHGRRRAEQDHLAGGLAGAGAAGARAVALAD